MTEKLNFVECAKALENKPIDRDEVLQNLLAVPEDISSGYVEGLEIGMEQLLVWMNIFTTKSPRVAQYLIEQLNEEHLKRLNKIVLRLLSQDVLSKIDELSKLTHNITFPEDDDYRRASRFIDKMKLLDDYKSWSDKLTSQASFTQYLANLFYLLDWKSEFEPIVFDKLAKLDKLDIEKLSQIIDSELGKFEGKE